MASEPALHRQNNFDAIRLIAAFAVLWDHQHALTGIPGPSAWGNTLGMYAVVAFFAISGYLVTKSWLSDPHLLRFAWRRALRLWPGLVVAVLLCAFVLGPAVTSLPLRDYFQSPITWLYLKTLHLHVNFYLPGVFTDNVSTAVNGSLWTIPLEVRCYVVLGLLGVFRIWQYRASSAVFLTILAGYLAWRYAPSDQPPHRWSYGLQYGVVFAIGMVLACWESLWLPRKGGAAVACAMGLLVLYALGGPVLRGQIAVYATACLAVLLGAARWPVLHRAGRWGDCSYGVYIYAFPVQQTLLWAWGKSLPNFWVGMLASMAVTCILAMLSWHFVEAPALRLKPSR